MSGNFYPLVEYFSVMAHLSDTYHAYPTIMMLESLPNLELKSSHFLHPGP
jgi:hypothetical protein